MNHFMAESMTQRIIESKNELAAEIISQISDKTDITEEQFSQDDAEAVAQGLITWITEQFVAADFDEIEISGVIDGKRLRGASFIQVE